MRGRKCPVLKGRVIIMNGMAMGFVVGLMIAAIALVFIFKYANKDGKIKTEYDERQKAVRGKAYQYAFYAEVFAQAVLMIMLMSGIELPVENYALVFIAVIFGCTVLAVYCIWNDVYWGLNNNHKRYHMVFMIAILLNLLPVLGPVFAGSLFVNGKIGLPMLNIVVLVMMFIVYIELLVKKIKDKSDSREEG